MRGRWLSLVAVLFGSMCVEPVQADVVLLPVVLYTRAQDGVGGVNAGALSPASLPFATNHVVQDFAATAQSSYHWPGPDATFEFDFEHLRTGAQGSFAQSYGTVAFMSTTDVRYELDGMYTLDGAEGLHQQVLLYDLTHDAVLFNSVQESRTTPNESFVLGQNGGDYQHYLSGDIAGVLTAGIRYQLYYNYALFDINADSGASSSGDLHLNLVPVPAPGAVALAMLGVGVLLGQYRRRA